MAEAPKRPVDRTRVEASRQAKPAIPAGLAGETAKASDSVPLTVGPFNVLPTMFGRYRIEKLLGKGAMGAVYLAQDTQLDRPVALKVARVSATGSAKLIQRMETEAKAAAKVDHPQICKVYDFGEIDGIRFIALQYITGEDFKTYLKRVGRCRSPEEAVAWIVKLSRALEAAHEKGVIHRDLKPENVMLDRKNEPVIMDFGLARRTTGSTNAGLTQGMIVGTAAYMSPEQAIGLAEGIDHRSDLYALGVMLFEMLTGDWPFTGTAIQVMGQKTVCEPPSPLTINPNLPPRLAAICHKMIAKKKEERFSTCAEVINALESVGTQTQFSADVDVGNESDQDQYPTDFLHEPPVAPGWYKPQKDGRPGSVLAIFRRLLQPATQWWRHLPTALRWTILGCSASIVMFLAAVLFLRNGDALVKIEILSDDIKVTFHENTITLDDGEQKVKTVPGQHTIQIKTGNVAFETEKFTLNRGENPVVTVELVNSEVVAKLGRRTLTVSVSGGSAVTSKIQKGAPADAVPFEKKLFKVFPNQLTWHDAKKQCEVMGGRLAQISTAAENDFVMKLANSRNLAAVWLGATDEAHERTWLWNDGTGLAFNNFGNGQPDRSIAGKRYLVMMLKGQIGNWCNQPAQSDNWSPGFVCEWNAPEVAGSSIAEKDKTPTGIKNGDFSEGLKGWECEGSAANFDVFEYGNTGKRSLHTLIAGPRPKEWIEATGRLFQRFVVPRNAIKMEFLVHGGADPNLYVALKSDEKIVHRTGAYNSNTRTPVEWDISGFRGKLVTLEIVDRKSGAWGFIGADSFRIVESSEASELDRRAIMNGVGQWSISGDELVQSQIVSRHSSLVFGSPNWSNYNFSFEAKATAGTHGFKAIFHHANDGNNYQFALGNYFNRAHDVSRNKQGQWSRMNGMYKDGKIQQDRWYAVRIEVRGAKVTCFLDGKQEFVSVDPEFSRGCCGVAVWESAVRFRNFQVTNPDGTVIWKGFPEISGPGSKS